MTGMKLGGRIYNLDKIKEEDEGIFLEACEEMGKYEEIKGFWNKFINFFVIIYDPISAVGKRATKEYITAYMFFRGRRNKKEAEKRRKKFKEWQI